MKDVLNEELMIPGVSGLRVIDASSHPEIVSTNPMLSVSAVAEKAAVLEKKEIYKNIVYNNLLQVQCVNNTLVNMFNVNNTNNEEVVFQFKGYNDIEVNISQGEFSINAFSSENIIVSDEVKILSIFINDSIFQNNATRCL
jgi:hypothetical protein